MNVLKTKDLTKIYGSGTTEVIALNHANISVDQGEFVAVIGTSGSGKSTLLHLLGGLDSPTGGKVLIEGNDIFTMKDDARTIFRRRKIGFVFQSYNLVPVLSVYENIVFPIQLDGGKIDKNYIGSIIETLGLKEKIHAMPNQLSGGQQQRVSCHCKSVGNQASNHSCRRTDRKSRQQNQSGRVESVEDHREKI